MGREILFKAKRTDTGEWVEGTPINTHIGVFMCFDENTHYCSQYGYMEIDEIVKMIPETLCQYTGLTDKNSQKIWENDICIIHSSFIDEEDGYFAVEWDDEGARFVLYGDGLTVDFDNYHGHECEVIGNVFDNPELLEGGGSDA